MTSNLVRRDYKEGMVIWTFVLSMASTYVRNFRGSSLPKEPPGGGWER